MFTSPPIWADLLADLNWSDLFYVLIPILYVVAQFLGSKEDKPKKGGQEDSPAERKRRAEDDAERAERRRRIQEEIRRRIMGEESAHAPVEEHPQPALAPAPEYSRHAEPEQTWQAPEAARGEDFASDIERKLAEQRKVLAGARTARREARKKADAITRRAFIPSNDVYGTASKPINTGAVRSSVLRSLRSAQDVRVALVLGEVLAPPVSERKEIGGRLF